MACSERGESGAAAFDRVVTCNSPRAGFRNPGIKAAGERLELPANDEARGAAKKRVDTRADLPYTSPPLGNERDAKAARAAISASVL
jgi:hypothetical protein